MKNYEELFMVIYHCDTGDGIAQLRDKFLQYVTYIIELGKVFIIVWNNSGINVDNTLE